MGGSCFHTGCKSGYNGAKCHLFKLKLKASNETKMAWIRNIPKRQGVSLDLKKHLICHLHFEERYIIKEAVVKFNGNVIASEPRKWTLTLDAVPTIFSNSKVPEYFNKSTNTRRPPVKRESSSASTSKANPVRNTLKDNFKNIVKYIPQIKLPTNNWNINLDEELQLITVMLLGKLSTECSMIAIEKWIQVDSNCNVLVKIRGEDLTSQLNWRLNHVNGLNDCLFKLDKIELCPGLLFKFMNSKKAKLWNNRVYSNNCEVIGQVSLCSKCVNFKNSSSVAMSRNKFNFKTRLRNTPSSPSKVKAYVKRIKRDKINSNNKLKRKIYQLSACRLALKRIKLQFKLKSTQTLLDSIYKCPNIPDNLKLTKKTAVKISRAKSNKGKRYESDWLLQCLLLKIKSPKGYIHLYQNKLLPVPHPSTLQKLVAGIPCQFGFTQFIFDHLKQEMNNRPERDREVIISFDEMKVREALEYDKYNCKINGFVDYGEFTEDYFAKSKKTNMYADHALVIMIRSLNSNWVQPIGAFASRDACPGHILSKLILSAVVRLEEVGIRVSGLTCDGSSSNKNMWKLFGIEADDKIINKITHPCDDKRFLFFMSDVPHIFKCIRNNFRKKKSVKFNGKDINYGHYEATYDEDKRHVIRAAPKLTKVHIHPNPFQKMVVFYATQLFSRSTANAIKFYRNHGIFGLKGSEQTEEFTLWANDLFDALNANRPINCVKINSEKYQLLERCDKLLSDKTIENTFASEMTMESLRVTIRSSIELINYLIKDIGFQYILTSKFNQDCLERFFGILRSYGANDVHPTILSFRYLFRLLSLYVPTSRIIKGNIRQNSEECPIVLFDYAETLKHLKKENIMSTKTRHQEIDDQILEKIQDQYNSQSSTHFNDYSLRDHNYSKPSTQTCLIYHLAGYVAHKASKFSKCQDCINTLISDEILQNSQLAEFTNSRDFGGLKYPSENLFRIINNTVEPAIFEITSQKLTIGDITSEIIKKITFENEFIKLGCENELHSNLLLVDIISFYISIRLFFHIRKINKSEISSGIECKKKIKEAKLK